jgi:hypothetical protein
MSDQSGAYFGVVRIGGPGGGPALYDIVEHHPGYSDRVLACRAVYPDAVVIVDALNRETNHRGGADVPRT